MGLIKITCGIVRSIYIESVKEVSSPLNTVLNLVREVTESAHRDRLLRRVLRITVALSLMWDNHL